MLSSTRRSLTLLTTSPLLATCTFRKTIYSAMMRRRTSFLWLSRTSLWRGRSRTARLVFSCWRIPAKCRSTPTWTFDEAQTREHRRAPLRLWKSFRRPTATRQWFTRCEAELWLVVHRHRRTIVASDPCQMDLVLARLTAVELYFHRKQRQVRLCRKFVTPTLSAYRVELIHWERMKRAKSTRQFAIFPARGCHRYRNERLSRGVSSLTMSRHCRKLGKLAWTATEEFSTSTTLRERRAGNDRMLEFFHPGRISIDSSSTVAISRFVAPFTVGIEAHPETVLCRRLTRGRCRTMSSSTESSATHIRLWRWFADRTSFRCSTPTRRRLTSTTQCRLSSTWQTGYDAIRRSSSATSTTETLWRWLTASLSSTWICHRSGKRNLTRPASSSSSITFTVERRSWIRDCRSTTPEAAEGFKRIRRHCHRLDQLPCHDSTSAHPKYPSPTTRRSSRSFASRTSSRFFASDMGRRARGVCARKSMRFVSKAQRPSSGSDMISN